MPILNYTTTVPATKTILEIESKLIQYGVKSIMKNIDDSGRTCSLSFLIVKEARQLPIQLPVQLNEALEVLRKEKLLHPSKNIKATPEHAERVAWRVMKDWIEVQLALVEFDQVRLEQVFMPYIVGSSGRTLFQELEQKQFCIEAKV